MDRIASGLLTMYGFGFDGVSVAGHTGNGGAIRGWRGWTVGVYVALLTKVFSILSLFFAFLLLHSSILKPDLHLRLV